MALGPYDRARPADALVQLLTPEQTATADQALQVWLADHLGKPLPQGLRPKRFADALVEAMRAITLIPLPQSRAWCTAHHATLRAWLRGFYLGNSRDPEGALLVALTYGQTDRGLLALWLGIVRQGRPLEHVRHALLGLRLMPADDQGEVERGLPKALLRGLLDFGEALARTGDRKGRAWLDEVDFLAAVYPMSKEQWGRHFREQLQARDTSHEVRNWLDKRYPAALNLAMGKPIQGFLLPPHVRDFELLLQRMASDFSGARPQLVALLERHRHYARESGDSYYLVRTFCRAGDRLIDRDPAWARDLAHEAAHWEPNNPHSWSLLARALESEGDWRRAEAVYWHARRRFPHDPFGHTQLGHALVLHSQAELGEAVFREAIRLFPDDPVCWAELAHTLHVTGQPEAAVATYRQAQQSFHRDPVIAGGLTDTLIDLGRLDEAAEALVWAEQVASAQDKKDMRKVEEIRQRLRRAQDGVPVTLRSLTRPLEGPGGDLGALADITGIALDDAPRLGRIGLWRRQGNGGLERARAELDQLPEGSVKLIETGLWRAVGQDWRAAADWFDACWEGYAGDGVLRVHRQRAHARAGDLVDWSVEQDLYPGLLPVILTEQRVDPPHLDLDPEDPDLSEEQRLDLWFAGLVAHRQSTTLRDFAEEDFLAARHLA